MTSARARSAWLAGLVLGAIDGLLQLELPIAGYGLALVALGLFVWQRAAVAGTGGLLLAGGVVWFTVLVAAVQRCAAEDSLPNTECHMGGDITPFVIGGLAAAAIGLGLTVLAVRRGG